MRTQKYDLFEVFIKKPKSPLFEHKLSTYNSSNAYHFLSESLDSFSVAEVCFRKSNYEMKVVLQFFEDGKGKDRIEEDKERASP